MAPPLFNNGIDSIISSLSPPPPPPRPTTGDTSGPPETLPNAGGNPVALIGQILLASTDPPADSSGPPPDLPPPPPPPDDGISVGIGFPPPAPTRVLLASTAELQAQSFDPTGQAPDSPVAPPRFLKPPTFLALDVQSFDPTGEAPDTTGPPSDPLALDGIQDVPSRRLAGPAPYTAAPPSDLFALDGGPAPDTADGDPRGPPIRSLAASDNPIGNTSGEAREAITQKTLASNGSLSHGTLLTSTSDTSGPPDDSPVSPPLHLDQHGDLSGPTKDSPAPPSSDSDRLPSSLDGLVFPAGASLAIAVRLGDEVDVIQVVPEMITSPQLMDISHYTSNPGQIFQFERDQLAFRTRTLLALGHDMADRAKDCQQYGLKNQVDVVNYSISHALKLINELSMDIDGDSYPSLSGGSATI